jgi:stage V sporulation protein R
MTQAERAELERWIEMIYEKALELGLDPFPVHFEVVPAHVIYELGAYALPARFSHWTFGRDYHVQKTMYEYGISRIYELVFNCDPSQAFLLDVNDMVAHKLVIAHVYGHSDFFKNNIYFEHTDRKMIERARLHAERIRHYEMVHGPLVVEQFLDAVLSVEEHIDPVLPTYGAPPRKQESQDAQPTGDTFEDLFYMAQPKPKPEPKKRKIPEEPQKDLLLFIRDHSRVLEDWQRDIISMIREEMLYFLPQIKTKIINEGWACATGDSLLITSRGIMRFDALYAERQSPVSVAVGEPSASCAVLDYHCQPDTPTIRITTKRGFTIEGAHQHRVLLRDGRWVYLQDIAIGDEVALAVGTEVWSESYQPLPAPRSRSATLADVAREAGVSYYTVLRHLRGRKTLRAAAIEQALKRYNIQPTKHGRVLTTRHNLCLPEYLNEELAYLLGYFVGDGNFTKSGIGFTTGDAEIVERLTSLLRGWGCNPRVKYDLQNNSARWRIAVHSRTLRELLIAIGLSPERKARQKVVPPIVLQSPREVVAAFLRGYFDADAYAGSAGVILSSASESLIRTVQTSPTQLRRALVDQPAPARCLPTGDSRRVGARLRRENRLRTQTQGGSPAAVYRKPSLVLPARAVRSRNQNRARARRCVRHHRRRRAPLCRQRDDSPQLVLARAHSGRPAPHPRRACAVPQDALGGDSARLAHEPEPLLCRLQSAARHRAALERRS